MIIRTKAFPRAALIGNPSDGYYGKTIAFVFSNYDAEVQLYESPELDLLPSLRDHSSFKSIDHLAEDVGLYGYYGGIRLLKATIKKFHEYCQHNAIELDDRNFTIRYQTTIPNRLGLAGSSAIITACIRALKRFYNVKIAKPILANLVLSVEREELGIDAGLQDRVAQSYNVPVFMDFERAHMNEYGYGVYKEIELPESLKLYIAFRTDLSEGSETLHGHLREDYENDKPEVLAAMTEWAKLTEYHTDGSWKRGKSDAKLPRPHPKNGCSEIIPSVLPHMERRVCQDSSFMWPGENDRRNTPRPSWLRRKRRRRSIAPMRTALFVEGRIETTRRSAARSEMSEAAIPPRESVIPREMKSRKEAHPQRTLLNGLFPTRVMTKGKGRIIAR